MPKVLPLVLVFSLAWTPLAGAVRSPVTPLAAAAAAQDQAPPEQQPQEQQPPEETPEDQGVFQPYEADQLDNLLARIALYPDPLLAQVLVAATFPDQIDDAARWVRSYGQNGVDDQAWDVSVRAVAHYAAVLNMMDDDLDWTTAVGQAYVYQSTDVMASIQRLRAMAQQQGNLVSTPQQEVVYEDGYYSIWPASPQYIYAPVYDPSIVFFRRAYSGGFFAGFSFGPALLIGVWLNRDCDWRRRRVYYTGWQGRGWIARSRPRIRMNAIYVNPRFSNIVVKRRLTQRPVNFVGLARYQSIHRNVNFRNHSRGTPLPARAPVGGVPNKIIDRNIPPNQPLNQFRGWQQPAPAPIVRRMPQQPRPAPMPERTAERPQQPHAFPQVRQAAPAERTVTAQPPSAFGRGDSTFNTHAASERGRESRRQMNQKPAARPPAPKRQPAPKSQGRTQHPGRR